MSLWVIFWMRGIYLKRVVTEIHVILRLEVIRSSYVKVSMV